ncbi:hypothetical protein NSA56_01470 [Oceanobacillus caeni]|uniref:hypothetical protein n=1 Tax=Oceanobacillus caeni TaxID=405946 RepID=UPI00214A7774|nr:hypothetical protein [Oceanobacillus caeni]MCR1833065.1 hypothetical protein [Oceanobacillus caeni]
MRYLAVVANGDYVTNRRISGVEHITIAEGVYVLYDKENKVLFSSPADSLVYLELE